MHRKAAAPVGFLEFPRRTKYSSSPPPRPWQKTKPARPVRHHHGENQSVISCGNARPPARACPEGSSPVPFSRLGRPPMPSSPSSSGFCLPAGAEAGQKPGKRVVFCKKQRFSTKNAPPQTKWGDSNTVWGAPHSVWGASNMVWGAPHSVFGDATAKWGAPHLVFGDATAEWGAPHLVFGDATAEWGAPPTKWGAPLLTKKPPLLKWGTTFRGENCGVISPRAPDAAPRKSASRNAPSTSRAPPPARPASPACCPPAKSPASRRTATQRSPFP